MLAFYEPEALPYKDIKSTLRLPDGSLGPNILWLKQKGYIKPVTEKVEGSKVVAYRITTNGKEVYDTLKDWLVLLFNMDKN